MSVADVTTPSFTEPWHHTVLTDCSYILLCVNCNDESAVRMSVCAAPIVILAVEVGVNAVGWCT